MQVVSSIFDASCKWMATYVVHKTHKSGDRRGGGVEDKKYGKFPFPLAARNFTMTVLLSVRGPEE